MATDEDMHQANLNILQTVAEITRRSQELETENCQLRAEIRKLQDNYVKSQVSPPLGSRTSLTKTFPSRAAETDPV